MEGKKLLSTSDFTSVAIIRPKSSIVVLNNSRAFLTITCLPPWLQRAVMSKVLALGILKWKANTACYWDHTHGEILQEEAGEPSRGC